MLSELVQFNGDTISYADHIYDILYIGSQLFIKTFEFIAH